MRHIKSPQNLCFNYLKLHSTISEKWSNNQLKSKIPQLSPKLSQFFSVGQRALAPLEFTLHDSCGRSQTFFSSWFCSAQWMPQAMNSTPHLSHKVGFCSWTCPKLLNLLWCLFVHNSIAVLGKIDEKLEGFGAHLLLFFTDTLTIHATACSILELEKEKALK